MFVYVYFACLYYIVHITAYIIVHITAHDSLIFIIIQMFYRKKVRRIGGKRYSLGLLNADRMRVQIKIPENFGNSFNSPNYFSSTLGNKDLIIHDRSVVK